MNGLTRKELNIKGDETFSIIGLESNFVPHGTVKLFIHSAVGIEEISLTLAIDTQNEIEYIKNGGILNFVIRNLIKQ
jgi:aconitate hydratase